MKRFGMTAWVVGAAFASLAGRATGQDFPWVTYTDEASGELCEVINLANAELMVSSVTGKLILVTGPDTILDGTYVGGTGTVYLTGEPTGQFEYADDAFGFRKLFWFDTDGFMIGIDPATGDFVSTTTRANEIDGVCAACEVWDDPRDCPGASFDSDQDGVDDEFDLCDNTPLDEAPDEDGCSCSQNDSDDDGIDDCIDLCPDTLPDDLVDDLGCGCAEFDDDDDGVSDCDDECPFTPSDELADEFGCSCSAYDGDDDGVDDCVDDCPNTPLGDDVDLDGCSEGDIVVVEPPPVVIACGNFSALTMMGLFAGLCSMRIGRVRRNRLS